MIIDAMILISIFLISLISLAILGYLLGWIKGKIVILSLMVFILFALGSYLYIGLTVK